MRGRPLASVAAVGVWASRHRLVAFSRFRGRSVLQRAVGRRPGARVAGRPTRACPRRSGAHVRNPRPFCFERARMRPRHAAAPRPRRSRRRGNVRGARGVRRAVRTVGSVLSRSQPSRRLLRQRRRLSPAHGPDKPRLPRRPRLPRSIERGRLCPFQHVWRIRQVLQRRTGNTGLRGLAARRIRRIPAVGVRHEGTVRRRAVPTAAQGMPLPHARIHVQSGRGVRPAESGLCREHRQHVPPPRVDAAVRRPGIVRRSLRRLAYVHGLLHQHDKHAKVLAARRSLWGCGFRDVGICNALEETNGSEKYTMGCMGRWGRGGVKRDTVTGFYFVVLI